MILNFQTREVRTVHRYRQGAHQAFPLYKKHAKALESMRCGFRNKVPRLYRLFSSGRPSHEGLGPFVWLQLDNRAHCSVER
jgi:hypothetical protein